MQFDEFPRLQLMWEGNRMSSEVEELERLPRCRPGLPESCRMPQLRNFVFIPIQWFPEALK